MSISLFVRDFTGNTISLGPEHQITLQTTVALLRNKISTILNIDQLSLTLIFRENNLQDGSTLYDYNVENNSTIIYVVQKIVPTQQQTYLSIFVRGLTGSTTILGAEHQLTTQTTVVQLKNIVSTVLKIDKQGLILIFQSKEMQDGSKLYDYNIENNSTIICAFKVIGGKQGN